MTARIVMKLRVVSARMATPEVMHLTFEHPLRPELPQWTPGAHVDLHLPDGKIRQYSLCGDPDRRDRYEIAVKREDGGRGGSKWVHGDLAAGDIAHVSAPRNNFPLQARARRHLFVAGGIGVTPFVAMARCLSRDNADFELNFCSRSSEQAPLLAALRSICGERLKTWFSADDRRFDPADLPVPEPGVHLYACGPQRLVDAVRAAANDKDWPADHVHIEVFQATLDENFKAEPFEARIASSGAVLHIPADRSLLDVLRDNGFVMPSSCELGVCGSCVCGYRDGVVIHRDSMLPVAARQDRMAPCVSRARVAVTLDL